MNHDRLNQVALATAAARAIETRHGGKEKLLEDKYAFGLLPALVKGLVGMALKPGIGPVLLAKREKEFPGLMGSLICRTRYIDDAVGRAVKEGASQVVLIGAELDTRAYRLPCMNAVNVFEVDSATTLDWKQRCMKAMLPAMPPNVSFVPIRFEEKALSSALLADRFDRGTRTCFIWDGMTPYLKDNIIDSCLADLTSLVSSGSTLILSYIHRDVIENPASASRGTASLLAMLVKYGEPWIFGILPAEIDAFMEKRGYRIIDHVGAMEYEARYLATTGRKMDILDAESVVTAVMV